jgi:ATPase components of ABC transporters with duplicated ATPase domains
MERFWFDTDAQWAPIGTLSGGEAWRLGLGPRPTRPVPRRHRLLPQPVWAH